MSTYYAFLADDALLYLSGQGACSGADFLQLNRDALADPRRRPGQRALIDMRTVGAVEILPEEMHAIVAADRDAVEAGAYGSVRTALLARDEMGEILGELYNALVRDPRLGVRVFYVLGEALEWLGMPHVEAEVAAEAARLENGGAAA